MNIRKFLMFTLTVNLTCAFAFHWTKAYKALVIANSLALLFFIAQKVVTKED